MSHDHFGGSQRGVTDVLTRRDYAPTVSRCVVLVQAVGRICRPPETACYPRHVRSLSQTPFGLLLTRRGGAYR